MSWHAFIKPARFSEVDASSVDFAVQPRFALPLNQASHTLSRPACLPSSPIWQYQQAPYQAAPEVDVYRHRTEASKPLHVKQGI